MTRSVREAAGIRVNPDPRASPDPRARPELRARFDGWANTYDQDTARYGWCAPRELLAAVARHEPPAAHHRVVDLGVGTGQASAPYLEAGARVVGLDLSPAMLERAPPGFFRLVEHDLDAPFEAAGLAPEDADLILGCGVLHFVRDLEGLLASLAEALDAGGFLAFTYVPPQERAFSSATRVRTPAQVETWLRAAGLELLEHRRFVAYHEGARTDDPVFYGLVVARDRRARPALEGALARIDRTACVDRPRLRHLASRPLVALPTVARTSHGVTGCAGADSLRAALRHQVAAGEIALTDLPWAEAPGLADPAGPEGCDLLAIFAHPDDESIFAGGTLATLAAAGHRVELLVLSDGGGGRSALGPEALARLRRSELERAAAALGLARVSVLDFPDFGKHRDATRRAPFTAADTLGRWGVDPVLDAIVAEIRAARPRVVLGFEASRDPNYSLHGHHLAVGVATAVALRLAAARGASGRPWAARAHWAVVAPEDLATAGVERRGSLGVRLAVAGEVAEAKARAVAAHASQSFSSAGLIGSLRGGDAIDEAWWLVQGEALAPSGAPPAQRLAGSPGWGRPLSVAPRSPARAWLAGDRVVAGWMGGEAPAPSEPSACGDSVVVTGQQVGIFGGPGLTLHKALGARALAAARGGEARFWMATQDHDLDEVATLWLPHPGGWRRHRWCPDDPRGRGREVGGLVLGREVEGLRDAALEALAGLPAVDAVAELLARHYRPGNTLAGAFAGLLEDLVPGVEAVDPRKPALARRAAPLFRAVLDDPGGCLAALEARAVAMRAMGLEVPVDRGAGVLPLFVTDEAGRRRGLRWSGGERFEIGDRELHARGSLLELLAAAPGRFTPDVLMRPAVQDHLLGSSDYVGGPGELSYWAQATALHRWLGVRPAAPRLRPLLGLVDKAGLELAAAGGLASPGAALELRAAMARGEAVPGADPAEAALLEGIAAVRRCVGRLPADRGRDGGALAAGIEAAAAALEAQVAEGRLGLPTSLEGSFRDCLAGLRDAAEAQAAASPACPPSRRGLGRALRALRVMERHVARSRRRREAPWRALAETLEPRGRPQERAVGLVALLARFGPDLGAGVEGELGAWAERARHGTGAGPLGRAVTPYVALSVSPAPGGQA